MKNFNILYTRCDGQSPLYHKNFADIDVGLIRHKGEKQKTSSYIDELQMIIFLSLVAKLLWVVKNNSIHRIILKQYRYGWP